MAANWQQGSAARELSDSDRYNPFQPLDYAARLQNAGKQPSSGAQNMSYAPGQLYGRPMTPPKPINAPEAPPARSSYAPSYAPLTPPAPLSYEPSAAPVPAPQMEPPSYLQPQHSLPPMPAQHAPAAPQRRRSRTAAQAAQPPVPSAMETPAGALYSADLFAHQPTAVMPSGYDDTPFASRSTEELNFFSDPPPAPVAESPSIPQQPVFYDEMLEDRPWRDAFTPAAPREDAPPAKPKKAPTKTAKPPRPRMRIGRLMALIISAVMLLFCLISGGQLVLELSRNENDMSAVRDEYYQRTGQELHRGAARVDLLPGGQTFVPTATPSPTAYVPTPAPTPIFPVGEAALGAAVLADQPETTDEPVLRTRLKSYPDNPLRNVQPGLTELMKENKDVIGHLVIDGVLDEIVMQRNNTYYLTHNSLGASSAAGAVFADEGCSFRIPPENLLLRGQCVVPGKTFHGLLQFASGGSAFASAVPTARLTTLYEEKTYLLFAVIAASSDPASPKYFNYASHPTFTTDEAMAAYVQSAKQHSLYPFNVDVQPSDRLLTLATMGGSDTLVLMYRMARDNENF